MACKYHRKQYLAKLTSFRESLDFMIILTKLDNQKILINLETVKYLEAVPDTLIFFTNGESIMVKESLDDIANAVARFHAEIVRQAESATTMREF